MTSPHSNKSGAENAGFRFVRVQPLRPGPDGAVELALCRPAVNVIHLPMMGELSRALEELAENPPKTLVITSAWPRIFSAGVSVEDHLPESLESMLHDFHRVCQQLLELPATTIALVRGGCVGGALELVSCCDFVVAESTAWFQQPEIDLGCFAPWAAAWYPQWMGTFRSRAILHLGERFDAEKAQAIGLVYRIAPEGRGVVAAARLAARLGGKSRVAASALKESLRHVGPMGALPRVESIYRQRLAASRDMQEGLAAFLEKRRPAWSDS